MVPKNEFFKHEKGKVQQIVSTCCYFVIGDFLPVKVVIMIDGFKCISTNFVRKFSNKNSALAAFTIECPVSAK